MFWQAGRGAYFRKFEEVVWRFSVVPSYTQTNMIFPFLDTTMLLGITTSVFVGVAAGYLGSFMVLRRMALVGDALSHVALPGVALALLFNVNPFLGAFATLFAGIIGIWLIEHKTELPVESLVGLFFTVSLAVGILITPDEHLIEVLFGDISSITLLDAALAM